MKATKMEKVKAFGQGIKDLVTDKQGQMFTAGFVVSAGVAGGFFYAMGVTVGAYLAVGFYSFIIAGTAMTTGMKVAINNKSDTRKMRKAGTAFASLAIAGIFATVAIKPFCDANKELNEHLKANAIEEEKRKIEIEAGKTLKVDCSGKISREFYKADAGKGDLKIEMPKGCTVVRKFKI